MLVIKSNQLKYASPIMGHKKSVKTTVTTQSVKFIGAISFVIRTSIMYKTEQIIDLKVLE